MNHVDAEMDMLHIRASNADPGMFSFAAISFAHAERTMIVPT